MTALFFAGEGLMKCHQMVRYRLARVKTLLDSQRFMPR